MPATLSFFDADAAASFAATYATPPLMAFFAAATPFSFLPADIFFAISFRLSLFQDISIRHYCGLISLAAAAS
jgi:hypothetical protein